MDECQFVTTVVGVKYCQINEMRICTLMTEETCAEYERLKGEEDGITQ